MRRTRRNPVPVTQTEAFRRWFGDSKVVDERGEPLVVWHGTNKSFDVFKTRSRSVNSTTFGPVETERSGIFVSDNPEFSREFGGRLLALYARIENPAEISAAGSGAGRDPALDFAETIDAFTERDLWLQAKHVSRPWQLFDGELGPRFIAYLQELGHDGATFVEDVPKGDDVGEDEQEYVEGRTYVVFDPRQVKSATDNDGTFDVDDPDLRANPPTLEVVDTEEWDDGTVVEFVAVPFPYERKPLAYRDDPTAQGSVRLDELIATQRRVTKAGVMGAGDAPITVLQTTDGRRYIADGHHRAVAAWLRGDDTIPAVVRFVRE
jgi:hypothetical protein